MFGNARVQNQATWSQSDENDSCFVGIVYAHMVKSHLNIDYVFHTVV